MPRIRIGWLMAFIAVVALELWAMRAIVRFNSRDMNLAWLVQIVGVACQGVLTVLAIGLLVGYRWRAIRPFLVGFEAFGIAALALFIAGMVSYSQVLLPHFQNAVRPLVGYLSDGPYISTSKVWLAYCVVEGTITLPLVAFAAIGGFLTHRKSAAGLIAVLTGPIIGAGTAGLGVLLGKVEPSDVKFHALAGAAVGLIVGSTLGLASLFHRPGRGSETSGRSPAPDQYQPITGVPEEPALP
jgi:hypothetical protein